MNIRKKLSFFIEYIRNTSFHGFKFIVGENEHWTGRIFWTVCCILSWLASIILIRSAWDDFQNNAISFVVETNYLDWNTKFPSITVCETDNQERIADYADRTYGNPHDYNFNEIVKEMVFFRGLSFYTLQMCGPNVTIKHEDCFKRNFIEFSKEVRSPCDGIFRKCTWNSVDFNCCEFFQRIDTEVGKCFAINSLHIKNKSAVNFPMISNRKTGPGKLILELNGMLNVYLLGEQETPTMTTFATDFIVISPHTEVHRYIAIREIENQPEVKDVSVAQRKCKFINENDLEIFKHYSYSACCVNCRKRAQIAVCGCVHHLMPNVPENLYCNINGLYCLNKHYNELVVLKASWSNRTGLVCDCLPSCTEFEMTVVKDKKRGLSEDFGRIEISLERLPTERYKRNVVRGRLDLVGGITALFLGASILSMVEVIYYFCVKPFGDGN